MIESKYISFSFRLFQNKKYQLLHKIRKGSGLDLRTISQQITFTQEQMRILNYWTASQVKKNRYRYLSL